MNIVVDSGSTKSSWSFHTFPESMTIHESKGFNPVLHNTFHTDTIRLVKDIVKDDVIESIYYYGAGVSEITQKKVLSALSFLTYTHEICIESDILGAARAVCGNEKGIVGILGTGSNSCFYDGINYRIDIPSLGYILSDEGGGVHLGKELLKAYFYGQMPAFEKELFSQKYPLNKDELIKYLYELNAGSEFIAKFASFLGEVKTPWTQFIIEKVLNEFIDLRILVFPEWAFYPVHFIGSIAHVHKPLLENCLIQKGIKLGKIVQKPIELLTHYHINKIK